MLQALAFWAVGVVSLWLWTIVAYAVPIGVAPAIPPSIVLLFVLFYIPCLAHAMLQNAASEGVMKTTPRKAVVVRKEKDEKRFYQYLLVRSGYVALSVFLVGWIVTASTYASQNHGALNENMWRFHRWNNVSTGSSSSLGGDLQAYWLVQDMMANQALLGLIAQCWTMLERERTVKTVSCGPSEI